MFSDILTPLPAMGVDFTIVPGKGPKIQDTIKGEDDLRRISVLSDVDREVPFIRPILQVTRPSPCDGTDALVELAEGNRGKDYPHRLRRRAVDAGGVLCGGWALEALREDEAHVQRGSAACPRSA